MQGAGLAVLGLYSNADLALGWYLTRPQPLGWILRPGSLVEGFAPGWSHSAWLLLCCWMLQAEEQAAGSAGWALYSSVLSETTHLSSALSFFQLKPISMLCY